mgnify:CR=1 FL=1
MEENTGDNLMLNSKIDQNKPSKLNKKFSKLK